MHHSCVGQAYGEILVTRGRAFSADAPEVPGAAAPIREEDDEDEEEDEESEQPAE